MALEHRRMPNDTSITSYSRQISSFQARSPSLTAIKSASRSSDMALLGFQLLAIWIEASISSSVLWTSSGRHSTWSSLDNQLSNENVPSHGLFSSGQPTGSTWSSWNVPSPGELLRSGPSRRLPSCALNLVPWGTLLISNEFCFNSGSGIRSGFFFVQGFGSIAACLRFASACLCLACSYSDVQSSIQRSSGWSV